MQTLSLKLEPVPGCDINEAVVDACRIARMLDLHRCYFSANGYNYACYPDNSAQKWNDKEEGRYWYQYGKWVYFPPL